MSDGAVRDDPERFDFTVETLGECTVDSPLRRRTFIGPDERVIVPSDLATVEHCVQNGLPIPTMERAGPREKIFHPPFMTRAAIVTCGGLCPGLNSVIKGLVETLYQEYGVTEVYGIPYGYRGLDAANGHRPVVLGPDVVDTIHLQGGSILGSSRGAQDPDRMVQTLVNLRCNVLFTVGGDGTLRGAAKIVEAIKRRRLAISVVGIPKTIDNDIHFVGSTFGFETAVYHSTPVITSAHVEAKSVPRGIGLVQLMGRDSGFIAAYASLANPVVNICLIPEVELCLEGEHGLLRALERRFEKKNHALIVVAEGAGQHLFADQPPRYDASGNLLKHDIGPYLNQRITEHFRELGQPVSMKYFDPSYLIRSVPASGTDQILCHRLAEAAVHAAMAGRTNVVVGSWNRHFVNVPISVATYERQKVDVQGALWRSVLASTRQEKWFGVEDHDAPQGMPAPC
ncbi:MAG: ATP-dependent 6-phosphofructokinase [Myxococcales bacterium]|jgi:6-phosphofructokinase 1|nr:ATP-dependent 6-phosphofructokinase [Myxococcales bacterium]